MNISEQQLLRILPNAGKQAGVFVSHLNRAMTRFGITSSVRQAAFLAQIGHESVHLTRLVENLNYSAQRLADVWPSRYATKDSRGRYLRTEKGAFIPTPLADQLARKPELIANTTYAARNGNGSISSGDGWRYRGRGLLQVTGRDNYRAAGTGIGQPLLDRPELLELPEFAALSAAWWWADRKLNSLADVGRFDDIGSIINTGQPGRVPVGADDRRQLWKRAQEVLRG
ncbi:glycoside hydrolase family 19 protein [Pseudomonas nitroreducens]|uniref:glycoside hydrolase family 19 protein n=1 Tax=Pseudomonas nitroreducens TaxID=46680 RepID=UPI0002DB19F4|nr:glycoside hydrolase family 19 protein [Pseudomonas nitroreducens]